MWLHLILFSNHNKYIAVPFKNICPLLKKKKKRLENGSRCNLPVFEGLLISVWLSET